MRGKNKLEPKTNAQGRSQADNNARRYAFIVARYYYYAYLCQPPYQYEHNIEVVARETYHSSRSIVDILLKHQPALSEHIKKKTPVEDLQKAYPHIVWSQDEVLRSKNLDS
jgi:hypothetical protein